MLHQFHYGHAQRSLTLCIANSFVSDFDIGCLVFLYPSYQLKLDKGMDEGSILIDRMTRG